MWFSIYGHRNFEFETVAKCHVEIFWEQLQKKKKIRWDIRYNNYNITSTYILYKNV